MKDIELALDSWYQEKRSAYLYTVISQQEPQHTALFQELATEAEKQALLWEQKIIEQGGTIPAFKLDWRSRWIQFCIKLFGVKQCRHMLAAVKIRGMSVYLKSAPGHTMPQSLEEVGQRHKSMSSGNNMRAAVFGVNDGLVSNASLLMGMVGSHADNKVIIIAGIAGLLAGAFSMGAGEYVSVRSQREMLEYQIGLEEKELALYPEEETEELALIYEARGLSKAEAKRVAKTLMSNPQSALDTLAREELGLDPNELVSPYGAAFFSFISFTIGAALPLLPFLFSHHPYTLPLTIGITGLSLFSVGAILSLYTGRNALKSGIRMLLIGAAAGSITYLIGHLLGVRLG